MVTAIDKNTALVLIDLQQGIATGNTVHPVTDVLANATKLAQAFRKVGAPVVLVHVNPFGAPWTMARTQESSFPKDAEAQKVLEAKFQQEGYFNIMPQLEMQAGDLLVTKKGWNAFYNTGLHEELQKRNITGIVLAGIATSIDVEGTARAASERAYNISFAKDAITDRIASAHEHSMNIIFPRIGKIDTTDAIIEKLRRR